MKKKMYIVSFMVMFFLILGFQYKVDYGIRTQTPSDKWSKEVSISKGNIYTFPKILKDGKNNIVAFIDGDKLQLVVTDDLGKKINEKTFETKDGLIKEVNLLKGQEFFYLSWNTYDNGSNRLKTIKLDKELNELEQTEIQNITNTYQIGEEILLVGYKDKIEILDMAKNSRQNFNIKGATLFSGTETENGFMFTYYNGKDGFSYITVENGMASVPKSTGVLNKSESMSFLNTATSSDSQSGYLLIEYNMQGSFAGTRVLRFALDGSTRDSSELYINDSKQVYNVVGSHSKEGARFFATTNRIFGVKDLQQSIVDFSLKDNKVTSYSYASRLTGLTTYPAISGDTIVYCNFSKPGEYGIYLASQNEQFKKINNILLPIERKQATLNTVQGFMYSLVYLTYPIKWIVSAVMLISIMTFFSYRFSDKKKKIYFLLVCIVSFVLKMSDIFRNSYGENIYLLPEILVHKWVALLVSAVISTICYSFGYKLYEKNLEGMAIGEFSIALALDTMLTMMIFVPFFITI